MRIRVIDRLLNLLAGLILLALTAALAAEAFLGWQISARVGAVLGKHDTVSLVIVAAVALALGTSIETCVGFFTTDSLSDVFTMVVVSLARRLDGIFEDQKRYLRRLQEQQKKEKGGF